MQSASFLGGASGRLLPASIPFRFFLAAAFFHVAAWVMLLMGADEVAAYEGGVGSLLGSIHLLTLGVLAMSVMGASFQLLPVVTRRALGRVWPARLCFWLMITGVALLSLGLSAPDIAAMEFGAALVLAGFAVFAVLTADNLIRARGLANVAAHGWGALVSLVGLMALAAALIADFRVGFLADHQGIARLHMIVAVFGFMGLFVVGFSQILIPMFALSRALPRGLGWVHLGLALGALAMFVIGEFRHVQSMVILGAAGALLGGVVYVWLMMAALKSAMRKRLGLSFVLIRWSWVMVLTGLLIGLALTLGVDIPNGGALFGFVILGGWLLTFLTGILQRIMPFLASMHGADRSGKPLLLSDLTAQTPLRVHAVCHLSALGLISLGIVANRGAIVATGAGVGLVGAIAFAVFAVLVVVRLR